MNARRLAAFQARAEASSDVYVHGNNEWRYVPVHPFADERDLLQRLGLTASECTKVDGYWEHDRDVDFLQVYSTCYEGSRPPGTYHRWEGGTAYGRNFVVVIEGSAVTRGAFEDAMHGLAVVLPPPSKPRGLTILAGAMPRDHAADVPRSSDQTPSKLRRDGRHCPVCLGVLASNASRTRRRRDCAACNAHPQPTKTCRRCRATGGAIWESRTGAACSTCGAHGPKQAVIASGA